jgi:hypothetical protein
MAVLQLFIDFMKAYQAIRKEAVCSNFTQYGASMKQVTLNKMSVNEMYIQESQKRETFV